MDDIATRHLALQQAVIAAGAFANDHSVVLELARHFAAFLDPRENLAPHQDLATAWKALPEDVFRSAEDLKAMRPSI